MAKSKDGALIKPSNRFFETVDELQGKIRERAYEIFRSRRRGEGDHLSDWFSAESDVLSDMAMELEEREDRYILRSSLPQFAPEEIDVQIEGSMLSVAGSHSESSSKRRDSSSSSRRSEVNFLRRMTLADDIDREGIEARFADGELEVVVPRRSG